MASAATVADSLRDNHTLLNLGLAHNSFSDFGSQVFLGVRVIILAPDQEKMPNTFKQWLLH